LKEKWTTPSCASKPGRRLGSPGRSEQAQSVSGEVAGAVDRQREHIARGRHGLNTDVDDANAAIDDEVVRRQCGRRRHAVRLARQRVDERQLQRALVGGHDLEEVDAVAHGQPTATDRGAHRLAPSLRAAVVRVAMAYTARVNTATCRCCVRRTMYCTAIVRWRRYP
jgi:hypothetical protein